MTCPLAPGMTQLSNQNEEDLDAKLEEDLNQVLRVMRMIQMEEKMTG